MEAFVSPCVAESTDPTLKYNFLEGIAQLHQLDLAHPKPFDETSREENPSPAKVQEKEETESKLGQILVMAEALQKRCDTASTEIAAVLRPLPV